MKVLDPVRAIKVEAVPQDGEVRTLLSLLTSTASAKGCPVVHDPFVWHSPSQSNWHHEVIDATKHLFKMRIQSFGVEDD